MSNVRAIMVAMIASVLPFKLAFRIVAIRATIPKRKETMLSGAQTQPNRPIGSSILISGLVGKLFRKINRISAMTITVAKDMAQIASLLHRALIVLFINSIHITPKLSDAGRASGPRSL